MTVKLARISIFITLAYALGWARQAHSSALNAPAGQGGVTLERVEAVYRFGEQVDFLAAILSPSPLQSASITVFDKRLNVLRSEPLTVNPDGTSQFTLDARQTAIRPFTLVYWRYDLVLGDGAAFQSDFYSFRYDDNRFEWLALDEGGLRLRWIRGDDAFARSALEAARAGLDTIGQYFPVELSQPIDIFIYPTQGDMQFPGYDSWVVGVAEPSSSAALAVIEPGIEQAELMGWRIPHELMHVIMYRSLGEGYDQTPAWLREGFATLVEANPTPEYDNALSDAAARGALIPFVDLCASFPVQSDSAFLAYAQARSFTAFLRDTFGVTKLVDLATAYADGLTCDSGVELVYGLTLTQLEADWRRSALGQDVVDTALQATFPYLVLLCVMLVIPLALGLIAMRQKPGK